MEGRISRHLLHFEIQPLSVAILRIMTTRTSIQLIKYVGVGGTAAFVEWISFALLVGAARVHYLAAVTVSFIVATAVNYFLSGRFVFMRGRHTAHKELILLYLVSAVGLLLNLLLMALFFGLWSIPVMPAKILATGVVFFWNFETRKMWVYEK
jgi:putative flippase GtrA